MVSLDVKRIDDKNVSFFTQDNIPYIRYHYGCIFTKHKINGYQIKIPNSFWNRDDYHQLKNLNHPDHFKYHQYFVSHFDLRSKQIQIVIVSIKNKECIEQIEKWRLESDEHRFD